MSVTHQPSPAVSRLQDQIIAVKAKINLLNGGEMIDYSGNRFDDALMAVSVDGKRDHWETKLLELEYLLERYMSSEQQALNFGPGITLGDVVTLQRKHDSREVQFRLVERVELYPDEKCMTSNSPLGKSVMGRQPGDVVTISTPAGLAEYQILELERG